MLTQLHDTLMQQEPQNGLFISTFDSEKNLVFSQGSRKEPADEVLTLIYQELINTNPAIQTIVLHIVKDVQTKTAADLPTIDLTTTGIGMHDDEGDEGAILPHTQGMENIKEALSALKTQSKLHGKAHLITFTTNDITFTKTAE